MIIQRYLPQCVEHKIFRDIIDYLNPEDMLVVNSSKVIPARLLGKTEKTGGDIELLLLRMLENGEWETLVRPGKRAKVGASFNFSDILRATVTDIVDGGNRTVKFEYDTEKYGNIYEVLDAVGNMPLPPYITEKLKNKEDYQTVYANERGSAAAPTAGLHFTKELLERIVENDDKQRFAFNEDKTLIRANQGHSISVDVELKEALPPKTLYHGTAEKYVESILRYGLLPRSRLYVHLSKSADTATAVGARHGKPVVYTVDSEKMTADGFKFFLSANGVWLTKKVPPEYLKK